MDAVGNYSDAHTYEAITKEQEASREGSAGDTDDDLLTRTT